MLPNPHAAPHCCFVLFTPSPVLLFAHQGQVGPPCHAPPRHTGTGNKPHRCTGCCQGLSTDHNLLGCYFSLTGFPFDDSHHALPCQMAYYTSCIRVSPRFTMHRQGSLGLQFPSMSKWGTFVFEACTIWGVSHCELMGRNDWHLMCFEHMRLINMPHYWSKCTPKTYQGKLHACWYLQCSSEAINKMYLEWPLCDQIKPTLYSQ
jgi:hypothetical protein